MSAISYTDARSIKSMRWVARILSILWAIWALFWTLFILADSNQEGAEVPLAVLAVSIIIMAIAILLFLGPAIISIKWRREALAGGVLLVDGVLIMASIVVFFSGTPHPFGTAAQVAFFTLALPPFIAGSLFLACHRLSKASGEQNA